MSRQKITLDGGTIYFDSHRVGWIHISSKTGEVRGEVNINGRRIICLGETTDEVMDRINKTYKNTKNNCYD